MQAVNNLVQRCTSKHGAKIKHKNNENFKKGGNKKKNKEAEEEGEKKGGQMTNQELRNKGKQTDADLDVILKCVRARARARGRVLRRLGLQWGSLVSLALRPKPSRRIGAPRRCNACGLRTVGALGLVGFAGTWWTSTPS